MLFRSDAQDGLYFRRLDTAQQLQHFGALLDSLAGNDLPEPIFLWDFSCFWQVTLNPIVEHLLMFLKNFLHREQRVVRLGFSQVV